MLSPFLPSSFAHIWYDFNDGDFECDVPTWVVITREGKVADCSFPGVINQSAGWGKKLISDYKTPPWY